MLAEDWGKGTMIWPGCVGYDKQLIDHYMRPFQLAYENYGETITKQHLNGKLCREEHHTLLDYLGQFMDAYPEQKKFLWAAQLGHNTENGVSHADKDFQQFFIQRRKQFDNSFVFFVGDHGFRLGSVRNTHVGAVDVNNPLTMISIPKALRENLIGRMIIFQFNFALHFTEEKPLKMPNEKGHSYIRKQPRNCQTMPIPVEYCICQVNKTTVPTNISNINDISKAVVIAVNNKLQEGNFSDKCIEMKLEKVVSLTKFTQKLNGAILYTINIQMKEPSKAEYKICKTHFTSHFYYILKANVKVLGQEVKVLGMVERNNGYGKTADCIKSEHHRPYCFCRNQTNN